GGLLERGLGGFAIGGYLPGGGFIRLALGGGLLERSLGGFAIGGSLLCRCLGVGIMLDGGLLRRRVGRFACLGGL
ncbi:hypothetical protein, partial [Burkholderia gladioli]|uniref:hypothetical protein n=1 Tax=Burkholderia gladioli TaxID=28095 RepID=UPI003C7C675A